MSISVPPWRVDEVDNIYSKNDFAVAIAWTADDARLIAAAPELLRLLKEVVFANGDSRPMSDWLDECRDVISRVEAAQ